MKLRKSRGSKATDRGREAAPGKFNLGNDRLLPIDDREKIGNTGGLESPPMLVFDPAMLIALAALISSLSAFIWSVRRKP
jgi:hypothetical protein